MDVREKVADLIDDVVADVFMFEKDYVAANHGLRFREDLATSSIQYFPIISALGEELQIDIDFHEFQYESGTIEQAIDYVVKLYNEQHK